MNRREFLGGMALMPFARQLQLHRAGRTPQRFVFLVRDNGLRPWGVRPPGLEDPGRKGLDTLIDQPLGDEDFTPQLAALRPFKDHVTIMEGLSGRMCAGAHGANFGALGAYRVGDHDPAPKPTVDAVLLEAFPGIFSHLGLKMAETGQLISYSKVSALGRAKPMSLYADPMLAYKDLFGTLLTGGNLKAEFDAEPNLLDFVVDDVRRVRRELTPEERDKLDQYLGGFEALRDRRAKLTAMGDRLKQCAPELHDKFSSDVETHRLEAHFDLTAAALTGGLTNVVTIEMDRLDIHYSGLELGQFSLHHVGHLEDSNDDKKYETFDNGVTGRQARERILDFHAKLIAGLAGKLQAVPEGDGTMLDNTLIVFLSDAADLHHAGFSNWPIVTVGNVRNRLDTGRYVRWPSYGKRGHRTIGNFHTTVLQAAGLEQHEHFGQLDLGLGEGFDQKGPLQEWLA